MADDERESQALKNGLKVLGETFVPGASLLIDEKLQPGLLHVGAGLLAGLAIGVPGAALVAANSFCTSLTGKNLIAYAKSHGATSPADVGLAEKVERTRKNLVDFLKLRGVTDLHDVNLAEKVVRDVKSGRSYEEIRDEILEDVEDLYHEATAKTDEHKQAG